MGKSLKGKELGVGISQRKDGKYIGRFTDRFGKRKSFSGDNLNNVRKRLQKAQFDNDKWLNCNDSDMTLDEWFETWETVCKVNCRQTTIRSYAASYKRIQPELGALRLNQLNLITIQRAFNNLKTDASRKKTKAILVDMLNCAVDADMIIKNPALKVKTAIDGTPPKEKRVLSDHEVELVINTAKEMSHRLYPVLVVGFNTGMRIGEILGLTWDKIDFKNNVIHVTQSLAYLYTNEDDIAHFVLNAPKTKSGIRDIPMTREVKTALLEQKMKCNIIYNRHKPYPGFDNLVFPGTQNHPIDATGFGEAIDRIRKEIEKKGEIVEPFTPHCMRHTFATKCIARGMKPKVLQKILGHKSLRMTMDLYCHVEDNTIRDEMSLFAVLA